jgi:hypothetical protein
MSSIRLSHYANLCKMEGCYLLELIIDAAAHILLLILLFENNMAHTHV